VRISDSLQVVPLCEEHLDAAAALAARRFTCLHEQEPLLPSRYASPAAFVALLRDLASTGAPGVVAIRDDRLVGFLTGWCMPTFRGQKSTYSPEWGNGAEPGESQAIYEELYRRLAADWASDGYVAHYVSLFPNDPGALWAFHWLGFGMHAVDAVRGLDPVSIPDPEIHVQLAGMDDLEALMSLDDGLWQHIQGAPTFLPQEPRGRVYWDEWLTDDPTRYTLLALVNRHPVGFLSLGPANDDVSTIIVDERTTSVYGAFTRPDARGKGIATALLDCALGRAREAGYRRCAVDFESANLDGTRFWLRHFRPVCLSLFRQIDESVVAL
jgi:GNAT superfamily N-acetyltransferase